MQLKSLEDYVEYSLNPAERYERSGGWLDLGAENPTYASELSVDEEQTCVSLRFRLLDSERS